MMMARKPMIRKDNEAAPEIVALDQLNSVSNGLKKTPKLTCRPWAIVRIPKETATTT